MIANVIQRVPLPAILAVAVLGAVTPAGASSTWVVPVDRPISGHMSRVSEVGVQSRLAAVLAKSGECRRCDLTGVNLVGATLRRMALTGVILTGANLSGAKLEGADLRNAELGRALLVGANLRRASLSGANLRGADLRSADLSAANLRGARLIDARLGGAGLAGADLSGADLSRVTGLTVHQLSHARRDGFTILPVGLTPEG